MKDVGSGTYYELMTDLVLTYTDTNLVEGASYNYKVYANNTAGAGTLSAIVTGVAGELPGLISDLEIDTQSSTALKVTWAAPTDLKGLAITSYWI